MMKRHSLRSLVTLIALMALLAGCAVNPATGGRDFVLMSENDELALGRQYSQQVMKEYRAYDNPLLQAYVQSVGDRVARVSHRKNLIYRFTLLDSAQVNAFALPGGYIYITRGLLAYLNSEAELAAVLGHELGHVTARHSVRQHGLSTATNLLGGIVSAASGVKGVGQITGLLSMGIVRGYGREHELEADGLGAEYLARAGYSVTAMRKVIATLKNQELFDRQLAKEQGRKARAYHGVFSTHPDNDTRLQQVLSQVSNRYVAKQDTHRQDTRFLKKLVGLTYGDSEEDGVTRGSTFYHAGLNVKVKFPNNWQIANRRNAVVVTAPKGEAYIQLVLQDLNQKLTPRQFIKKRLGVNKPLSVASLSVGGLNGYMVVAEGKTPYGMRKTRVAVVIDKARAYIFFAAAKEKGVFSRFDIQFKKVIKSFARLGMQDKRVAKELTLKLIKFKGAKGFDYLAKSSPITHHAEQQLRLLNGLYPTGERKSGDLIKIVR